MSKSLGTGIDPIEQIDPHGADALRFGLLMMSSTQDVRFSADRIDQGRQLVTKLWNASRLVRRPRRPGGRPGARARRRWPTAGSPRASAAAVEQSQALIAGFQLSQLADLVYHLVFDDYCDWYLELLKAGEATPEVAGHALEQLLALAHPLMPFVTEECWSRVPGAEGLMAVAPARGRPRARRPRGRGRDRRGPGGRDRPARLPLAAGPAAAHPAGGRPRRRTRRSARPRRR